MSHKLRFLCWPVCLLLPLLILAVTALARPWPFEDSDLKPDPTVSWSRLDNGIRYVFMPNQEPPGRISLRLRVDAGSLMEKENERGLAHFLEHMAFNGTHHFAADEMVEYFQRLGMAFGADTNAHTAFDETVFKLQLPNNNGELLDDAVKLLRDYADGMLLEATEIDRERGVILSEKRARDSVDYRSNLARLAFMFPGTIIPDRMPIGEDKVISGAPPETFMDFYRRWYTADRITIVCVGDLERDKFTAVLKKYFSDYPIPTAAQSPKLGTLAKNGQRAHLHTEMEAGNVTITMFYIRPITPEKDTLTRQQEWLRNYTAGWILNRRFQELAKQEDAPFMGAGTYAYPWLDFVRVAAVQITCAPDKWHQALAVGEQELRRALTFGYTASEVQEAQAYLLNEFQNAVRSASTRKSAGLSDSLVSTLGDNEVFMSPQQQLNWAAPTIAEMTAESLHQAIKGIWEPEQIDIFMTGNLDLENDAETIRQAFDNSQQVSVSPPQDETIPEFAYTSFGTPGKVTQQEDLEDLGISLLKFDNGTTVYLKKTDFEADQIIVGLRFGRGELTLPKNQPGLSHLASRTFMIGGLGKHSHDELKRILAGRNVNISFAVEAETFAFGGSTTPADVALLFQVVAAYMTDPGYRPEALNIMQRGLDRLYIELNSTPGGVSKNKVARFLGGGDQRFGYPAKAELMARTMEEVRHWLTPALTTADLQIAVVGDFEPQNIIEAVAKTLGALPKRAETIPRMSEQRKLPFPPTPGQHDFTFTSELPKAVASVCWPTEDVWDISRTRRLSILASILDDRLRVQIREKQGDTYSPYAYSMCSAVYTDFGYILGGIMAAPEKAVELAEEIAQIGQELATKGTNQDELQRILTPHLKQIEEYRRRNSYWLNNVLLPGREYPHRFDWSRNMVSDMEAISVDDINQLAERYLKPETAVQLLILPEAPTDTP